jgi:phosphatidylglycerophosphate synthase
MLVDLGQKLARSHDQLRLFKDRQFKPLVDVLPGWLTANQVTVFRTGVLLVWAPWTIWHPSLWQVWVFVFIYFLDLLDGALARLRNQVTWRGGYLDHLSDKYSNIAVLMVFYGLTGYQANEFLFFIWWDIIMVFVLTVETYSGNRIVLYLKSLFDFMVKIALWVWLVIEVFPALL